MIWTAGDWMIITITLVGAVMMALFNKRPDEGADPPPIETVAPPETAREVLQRHYRGKWGA